MYVIIDTDGNLVDTLYYDEEEAVLYARGLLLEANEDEVTVEIYYLVDIPHRQFESAKVLQLRELNPETGEVIDSDIDSYDD